MKSGRSEMKSLRGFSLIELLVVLLVIGLAVTMVSVNVAVDKSAYSLRQQGKDFANETTMLLQEAVLMRRQWGVDLFSETVDGKERVAYRWLLLTETGWRQHTPQGLEQQREFAADIVELKVEGAERSIGLLELEPEKEDEKSELKPDLLLLSSGEASPFELSLNYQDSGFQAVVIKGDQLGRIRVLKENDDAFE
jgi:general secretion pathway protein H